MATYTIYRGNESSAPSNIKWSHSQYPGPSDNKVIKIITTTEKIKINSVSLSLGCLASNQTITLEGYHVTENWNHNFTISLSIVSSGGSVLYNSSTKFDMSGCTPNNSAWSSSYSSYYVLRDHLYNREFSFNNAVINKNTTVYVCIKKTANSGATNRSVFSTPYTQGERSISISVVPDKITGRPPTPNGTPNLTPVSGLIGSRFSWSITQGTNTATNYQLYGSLNKSELLGGTPALPLTGSNTHFIRGESKVTGELSVPEKQYPYYRVYYTKVDSAYETATSLGKPTAQIFQVKLRTPTASVSPSIISIGESVSVSGTTSDKINNTTTTAPTMNGTGSKTPTSNNQKYKIYTSATNYISSDEAETPAVTVRFQPRESGTSKLNPVFKLGGSVIVSNSRYGPTVNASVTSSKFDRSLHLGTFNYYKLYLVQGNNESLLIEGNVSNYQLSTGNVQLKASDYISTFNLSQTIKLRLYWYYYKNGSLSNEDRSSNSQKYFDSDSFYLSQPPNDPYILYPSGESSGTFTGKFTNNMSPDIIFRISNPDSVKNSCPSTSAEFTKVKVVYSGSSSLSDTFEGSLSLSNGSLKFTSNTDKFVSIKKNTSGQYYVVFRTPSGDSTTSKTYKISCTNYLGSDSSEVTTSITYSSDFKNLTLRGSLIKGQLAGNSHTNYFDNLRNSIYNYQVSYKRIVSISSSDLTAYDPSDTSVGKLIKVDTGGNFNLLKWYKYCTKVYDKLKDYYTSNQRSTEIYSCSSAGGSTVKGNMIMSGRTSSDETAYDNADSLKGSIFNLVIKMIRDVL